MSSSIDRHAPACLGAVILSAGLVQGAPAAPPQATTFQITPDHAGVTTSGGTLALQTQPVWSVQLPGPISYPLIDDGGVYTLDDFANYEVIEYEPVRGTYRGYQILSSPLPSSGGTHIIQALNIMENYDIAAMGLNSTETLHVMSEAFKMCFYDRGKFMGDPNYVDVPISGQYGLFDNLHKFKDARALADAIRRASETRYGHAGPAFVRAIIKMDASALREQYETILAGLGKMDALEARAARVFALSALAGELAIEAGLVSWNKGDAIAAAQMIWAICSPTFSPNGLGFSADASRAGA